MYAVMRERDRQGEAPPRATTNQAKRSPTPTARWCWAHRTTSSAASWGRLAGRYDVMHLEVLGLPQTTPAAVAQQNPAAHGCGAASVPCSVRR